MRHRAGIATRRCEGGTGLVELVREDGHVTRQESSRQVDDAEANTDDAAGGEHGRCAKAPRGVRGRQRATRDRAIIRVLVDTGIRASELCASRVGDLVGARLFVRHGKGDKARPVFIGDVTRRAVTGYLSQRDVGQERTFVRVARDRRRAARHRATRDLQRLGKRAGVVVACHGLRRTFAVESLRAGCDLVRVARYMGHSDLTMLERHYLPLLEDDLAAAHRAARRGIGCERCFLGPRCPAGAKRTSEIDTQAR